MNIQFIQLKFFARGNKKSKPKKPYSGPLFKRPVGVRDPLTEERLNLENGTLKSYC